MGNYSRNQSSYDKKKASMESIITGTTPLLDTEQHENSAAHSRERTSSAMVKSYPQSVPEMKMPERHQTNDLGMKEQISDT